MLAYTTGAVVAVAGALLVDRIITRERLAARPTFWIAYAIIVFFQLLMNGFLTGIPIVTYDPGVHLGLRVAHAPVEDIAFGFALVLSVLTVWSRLSPDSPDDGVRETAEDKRGGHS